jgi:ATP-dependent DNA helicase RecG
MTKTELLELLRNGENSGMEFKRDDVENHVLAKEIVAFLNFQGGIVLLGVDDDGSVRGTTRKNLEEWVVELCRRKIEPAIIPYMSCLKNVEPGKDVLIIRIPAGPNKPYARVHNDRRNYFIRVGSTSREATQEELQRMFQALGRIQYGMKPVPGSTMQDMDFRRLKNYFSKVLEIEHPKDNDSNEWERLLLNLELLSDVDGVMAVTVDGLLLFGKNPAHFLPQSGIRAIAYDSTEPSYAAREDLEIKGALTPLYAGDGGIIESGLVEQALEFIRRNTRVQSHLDRGRRVDRLDYPEQVLRETIVNALVHRDYSIAGTDIILEIFVDRLEVTSPGRLPNTATVEALKIGFRYARNQTIVNVMRDYHYVDFRGMGIRYKIIPGMLAHNGTEPDFIETDHSFTVRLWKEKKQ